MPGTQVNRQWVLVLQSGSIVIDWGDGLYQDVDSGNFIKVNEFDISHVAQEKDLEILMRSGRVVEFNTLTVSFNKLPERPWRTLD